MLDSDKVAHIRQSDKSAVKLARDLGVSDVLIGKVRRGLLWKGARAGSRPSKRAIVLAGPRISELCGLSEDRLDLAGGRILVPPRDIGELLNGRTRRRRRATEQAVTVDEALHDLVDGER